MQIVIEEIDNVYYADVILNPNDVQKIHQAEMVTSEIIYKHRKCYVGVRLQGSWDYGEEKNKRREEGFSGDARVLEGGAQQRVRGRPRRQE